jgi:hypothetical protein
MIMLTQAASDDALAKAMAAAGTNQGGPDGSDQTGSEFSLYPEVVKPAGKAHLVRHERTHAFTLNDPIGVLHAHLTIPLVYCMRT